MSYKLLLVVLARYLRDESVAVGGPHGNAKSNDRIFYRTCPSVLKKIAEENESPENLQTFFFLEMKLYSFIMDAQIVSIPISLTII